MALLFMDGFDAGDVFQKWPLTSTAGFSSDTTTRYGYGRSVLRTYNQIGEMKRGYTATTTIIAGVATYYNLNYAGYPATLFEFMGDSGVTSHITLSTGDTGNTVVAKRGSTTLFTAHVAALQWHYLEMKVTIDSTVGLVELRSDGAVVGTFSGNTKNGGTNSSSDMIKFGGSGNNTGLNIYRDDFYLLDTSGSAPYNTYLGEIRVRALSPTAAGASAQFTPDSGSNYARVNEIPYSASNYVQSGVSGNRDTYAVADLPGTAGTILAVQNNVVAKKTDAASVSVKPAIKSGSTVYYGNSTPLTSNDVTVTDLRTVDPNTATAWTASGVNALEAGMEVA